MEHGDRILAKKVIPEWTTHCYQITLPMLKRAFGVKGTYIDDIRSKDMKEKKDDKANVQGIEIQTRQYKDELEKEERDIPEGDDSARG